MELYQVLDRGQADGILIRTPNQQWVVIDAGTNAQERDAMRDMGIDRVGLQRGDVLVEVDGTPIYAEDNPLWDVFATGSRVHLIVRRGGAPWETRIEVE